MRREAASLLVQGTRALEEGTGWHARTALLLGLRAGRRSVVLLMNTHSTEQESLPMVLDPASGSRMFYFDKADERVLFGDIRSELHTLCDGRTLNVNPDRLMDFRALPFPDETFRVVVFDPPHLIRAGEKSWSFKKYGRLDATWQEDLAAGFAECFRVLSESGVLIFKWNEDQIPVSRILALTSQKPLVGHRSGKRSGTHWITFIKDSEPLSRTGTGDRS